MNEDIVTPFKWQVFAKKMQNLKNRQKNKQSNAKGSSRDDVEMLKSQVFTPAKTKVLNSSFYLNLSLL
ncbi:hypothetical protein BS636_00290 [Acinetobacter sp. LoGeW2-3]|uniref:hypothetical protein n=1 Tax=Acinetobacter sp. LoGeW2-3 TaxID=1808001 RepID=UPI000C05C144|nr:hypothetical protein [Acinetobacter sp. LoGeW2-3]ATO18226.1 hypothetical protein BS636_00290 [Acinetobacter sp. LoGeW2-3]